MKSWLCGVGVAVTSILLGAACGDSDDGPPGAGGSTGGSGGSGGGAPVVCGDAGPSTDAGSAGYGGGTATGCVTVYDQDKITFTGAAAPTYTCNECKSTANPAGPNSCRNANDCAIINTGRVRELVRNCGLGCRSYEPPMGTCEQMATCNTDCVQLNTRTMIPQPGLTLSAACGTCYTNIALCSLAFCLSQCAANADAIECVQCQFENGCRLPFERCSGVDREQ